MEQLPGGDGRHADAARHGGLHDEQRQRPERDDGREEADEIERETADVAQLGQEPCEQHRVSLRDRVGLVHPVVVDVGCRNTVFNAQAQSAAALVPELLARGVTRLRVELVRESAAEARRVYGAYAALIAGTTTPADVVRAAAVHEQFGVTRGTMRTLTVLP